MRLRRIALTDFRSYAAVELVPAAGLTVIVGANGEGKTNLLEGIEAVEGDEVSLETIDALKPAVVRSVESQDYLYLLMPVRVS